MYYFKESEDTLIMNKEKKLKVKELNNIKDAICFIIVW